MRILVTGANGYLGAGVVKELLNNKCEVIAADLSVDKIDDRAEKIECNIFDIEDPFIELGHPDLLLHMAWKNGFVHNSATHLHDLPLHYNFIERITNGDIKKIVVMGTMHEIGFFEGSIKEDTPCNPQSLYGISKNALREATRLLTADKKIDWQWIRGFYIVGNSIYGSSIFSKIVQSVNKGEKHFPFTMGMNQWDFLDYDIFCEQVCRIVMQDKVKGIINACSGFPERLSDRVNRFILENGYDIVLDYGAFPDRPYDSKAVWGDDRKIKQIYEQINLDHKNNMEK